MEPGTPIRVAMTKWGDRPHWQFDGVFLGADEHGEWLGFPAGTHHHRPGREFRSKVACVTLVAPDAWYLPTLQAPGIWCDVYIDVATPATWDGTVLRAIDLDLDVVRLTDPLPEEARAEAEADGRAPGETFIDDEDEFLEHQATLGYPAEVVGAARFTADELLPLVRDRVAPYDDTAARWLDVLSSLTDRP
jgi:uncharacterized protein